MKEQDIARRSTKGKRPLMNADGRGRAELFPNCGMPKPTGFVDVQSSKFCSAGHALYYPRSHRLRQQRA